MLANGISFLALIWTALAIKALNPTPPRGEAAGEGPDFEGARFTMMEIRLRTLFILESITGVFGVSILAFFPPTPVKP